MNRAEFSRSLRQADTHRYREFVAQYLLKTSGVSAGIDPFAVELYRHYQRISTVRSFDEVISQTYVSRESVEREVLRGGSLITLGRAGSGLSTLGQWMARSVKDAQGEGKTLNVLAPVRARSRSTEPVPSVLHPHSLALAIFRAFLAQVVRNDSALGEVGDQLKKSRDWLERLNWLASKWARAGERRDTQIQQLVDKVASPANADDSLSHEDELLAAVALVLDAADLAAKSLPGSIRIIVDASSPMLAAELTDLLNDFEAFLDLCQEPDYAPYLSRVRALLMLNVAAAEELESLRSLREDRVPQYELEEWNRLDLEMLLRKRLEFCRPGEYLAEYWPRDLPTRCIKPDGREALLDLITEGGVRVYELPAQDVDAPIHALRLARCLLAALAGQWESAFPPPLSARDLEDLVNRYWEGQKEGNHGRNTVY